MIQLSSRRAAVDRKACLAKLRQLEKAVSQERLSESAIHEAEGLRDHLKNMLVHKRDRKRLARAQGKLTFLAHAYYFPEGRAEAGKLGEGPLVDTSVQTAVSPHVENSRAMLSVSGGTLYRADEPATEKKSSAFCKLRWLWDKHPEENTLSHLARWGTVVSELRLEVHHSQELTFLIRRLSVAVDNEPIFEIRPWQVAETAVSDGMAIADLKAPVLELAKLNDFRIVTAYVEAEVGSQIVRLKCWIEVAWGERSGLLRRRMARVTFLSDGPREVRV